MIKFYAILLLVLLNVAKNDLLFADEPSSDLLPGKCECKEPEDYAPASATDRPSDFLRGMCRYQARAEGGSESLNSLLRIAQLYIRDVAKGGASLELDINRPTNGDGYNTIVWWFESKQEEGKESPIHSANTALCNILNEHDRLYPAPKKTYIKIKAYLYSFESGYDREFGFEIASFFGNKSADPQKSADNRNDLTATFEKGIFNVSSGIGNPLASILNFGIQAALNKRHAQTLDIVEWSGAVGEGLQKSDGNNYYHPAITQTKDEKIGLHMSATPRIYSDDDQKVDLVNLDFFYAVDDSATNKDAPVHKFYPYQGETLRLKTNELFVLSNHIRDRDIRTGKLIGTGESKAHTQTILLMEVSKLDENTPAVSQFPFHKLDRSFTEAELNQLPNGQLNFPVVLFSIEPICYPNPANPYYIEPICGFRFVSLDRRFINYRMKFELDGPLLDADKRVTYWKLGEVYTGKGYYQLPLFNHNDPAQEYTLTIQIDDQGPSLLDRKKHETVGIQFKFTHYKDREDPIYYSPRSIRFLERGFWTKLFGG